MRLEKILGKARRLRKAIKKIIKKSEAAHQYVLHKFIEKESLRLRKQSEKMSMEIKLLQKTYRMTDDDFSPNIKPYHIQKIAWKSR